MNGITIKEIIEENAKKFAKKNALLRKIGIRWVGITYRDLLSQVKDLGTSLVKMGMKKGDRIALLTHNCPEWAISYLAIITNNGIVVPVDKELKAQELRHILEDSGSKFIIVTEELLPKIEEIHQSLKSLKKIILITNLTKDITIPDEIKDDMKRIERAWQSLIAKIKKEHESEIKKIEDLWLSLDKRLKDARIKKDSLVIEKRNRFLDFTKGLYEGTDVATGVVHFENLFGNEDIIENEMGYNETIAILYTSGTTGKSKGVMLTNENIITNFKGVVELMQVDDKILTLSVLPINHVYESTCGVIIPILLGGTVAFAESLLKVAQNLNEVKPNFFLGVPALYQALYTRMSQKVNSSLAGRLMNSNAITRKVIQKKIKKELGGSDIAFISGGGPFDPSLQEGLRKLGLNIFNGYGITETAPLVAVNSVVGGDRLGSVGKVMPEVEIKIENPNENGEGEIFIKGPNVMKGYFNNPKATKEVLTDGWYHSGDLGYLDDDNYLFVLGRVKNLIVTGKGKNIYPEEVETELERSPFIEEAMVYAHNLGTTGEEVRAVVYLNQDMLEAHAVKEGKKELEKSEIHTLIRDEIKRCCSNLADYKRVKEFMIRDEEFPKTSTRKIKRYAVEEAIKVN
ncbi:MAG: AMP-binding protein [Deltaproteobacteria bacterium]|uniref:AMP-binding protein n=1 Tax=Candidatus Zymogenus saltonus TaxID=2844893 RepID=A0A9D8KD27_9DELT|nr:AMP-binding protein [Candidatus Zymogenus saltonus]